MFEEKRRATRVTFSAVAHLIVPGDRSPKTATVANISRVGMGLHTDSPVDSGKFTTIHLMFKDPMENLVEWRTSGTIVRSMPIDKGYVIGVSLTRPISQLNAPELHSTLEQAGA